MLRIDETPRECRAALCEEILDDLPEWFGIPAAKQNYVLAAAGLPMLACTGGDRSVGFLSLKPQTDSAIEIFVMGVRRQWHRRGAGRLLITGALDYARKTGMRYLTVRTLAPDDPDPHYARTRQFYEAMDFVPIEIIPDLWGAGISSLLLVRQVK